MSLAPQDRPLSRTGKPSNPYARDPLPASSRRKLTELRERADDLSLSLRAASERASEARITKQRLEAQLRENQDPRWRQSAPPSNDQFLPGPNFGSAALPAPASNEVETARIRVELANTDSEIKRLKAIVDERSASWRPLATLLSEIDRYLESIPGTALREHDKPTKLPKGASLDGIRDQIATLRADLHQVRSAPRPSSEAKSAARAYVAELTERGRPRSDHLLDGLPAVEEWPTVHRHVLAGDKLVTVEQFDLPAVLAWLDSGRMIAAFERDINEMADDEHALTAAERIKREREIAAQILACERTEEVLCIATGAPRRPGADPRAILNLADSSPAPRED
jgi:hypothetical protein